MGLGLMGALGLALHWTLGNAGHSQDVFRLCFEAEEAEKVVAPFQVVQGAFRDEARPRPRVNSGSGYIEIPDKANGDEHDETKLKGEAVYRVKVPKAGTYVVWLRTWWLDGCGNSCRIAVNDLPPLLVGEDATYKVWEWRFARKAGTDTPLKLPFKEGVNILRVLNREDGIKVDQILITSDTALRPVGPMPTTAGALVRESP